MSIQSFVRLLWTYSILIYIRLPIDNGHSVLCNDNTFHLTDNFIMILRDSEAWEDGVEIIWNIRHSKIFFLFTKFKWSTFHWILRIQYAQLLFVPGTMVTTPALITFGVNLEETGRPYTAPWWCLLSSQREDLPPGGAAEALADQPERPAWSRAAEVSKVQVWDSTWRRRMWIILDNLLNIDNC